MEPKNKLFTCFLKCQSVFFLKWIRESTNEFFQSIVWNYLPILHLWDLNTFFVKNAKFSLLPLTLGNLQHIGFRIGTLCFLKKYTVSCKICIDFFHVHGVIPPSPISGGKKSVNCYLMQLNMGKFLALLAKFTILFRQKSSGDLIGSVQSFSWILNKILQVIKIVIGQAFSHWDNEHCFAILQCQVLTFPPHLDLTGM